jgi:hypothetical protein
MAGRIAGRSIDGERSNPSYLFCPDHECELLHRLLFRGGASSSKIGVSARTGSAGLQARVKGQEEKPLETVRNLTRA